MIRFSFIVIGYNEGDKLRRCFESIKEFGKILSDKFEIIYVDSRSEDNSVDLANQFKVDKVVIVEGYRNAAIARNLGAKNAQGDILFFIDGDMELLPSFASCILGPDKKLIHPFMNGYRIDYFYDNQGVFIKNNEKEIYGNLKEKYLITTGGLFIVEKRYWEELGGMDPRQDSYEDNDFAYKMFIKKNIRILKKDEVFAKHYTVSYINKDRIIKIVKGKYYYNKGLLLRKHLLHFALYPHFIRENLSFYILVFTILMSLISLKAIVIYPLTSIMRLYFIKNEEDSIPSFKRLYFNAIVDFKILYSLLFYRPLRHRT